MAKQSGIGMTVAVDDSGGVARDISNDITNLTFATPHAEQDVTGIDKSAHERLQLLADFSCGLNGVFNSGTANMSHDVFKTVPSTSVQRTVTITIATKVLANETLFSDYNLTRAAGGEFTWSAPGVLANGSVPTWA